MPSTQEDVIDGVSASVAIKAAVAAATTANITLSGEQTIDGVSVVDGDRVLVKDQTDTTENGIYNVNTSAWSRAADFDGNRDVREGTLVIVIDGTGNANTIWKCTSTNPVVIQTSNITFEQFLGTLNQASDSAAGAVELATDVEAQAKTDATRALTPANLAALAGSETFAGLLELATDAETQTGTDTARAITPANLSARTATTSRTGIAELATDVEALAAADTGRVLTPSNIEALKASQAQMESASSTSVFVTPGRQQYHPSAAKFWLKAGDSGNILASYNITSLTDTGTGDLAVTIATDMSGVHYCVVTGGERTSSTGTATLARDISIKVSTLAAGSFSLECWDKTATTNAIKDPTTWHCAGFGDQ